MMLVTPSDGQQPATAGPPRPPTWLGSDERIPFLKALMPALLRYFEKAGESGAVRSRSPTFPELCNLAARDPDVRRATPNPAFWEALRAQLGLPDDTRQTG
jgi:hypothetical protein